MSRSGKYLEDLEGVFGAGSVTSGYRSQEEQDALVQRGVTKATRSSHTYRDGYDLKIGVAKTPEELHDRLTAAGKEVSYIRRESGHGKNQGTGPHWHVEFGKPGAGGTRMAGGSTPTPQASRPQGVLDVAATVAGRPAPASSGGASPGPHDKVFGNDAEIAAGFSKSKDALARTGQALDVLNVAQIAAHSDQTAAMGDKLRDTKAISTEISQGVEGLKTAVAPVFQARQRVNDQLDHLTTMNPIERGVRGIFDLNYDKNYLTGQLDQYDRTLKAREDDFNYLNHLNTVALGEIERRYGIATAPTELRVQQGKEDLGLLGQIFAQSNDSVNLLTGEVQAQAQMAAAKIQMRGQALDRMTKQEVAGLLGESRSTGGRIVHDGIDFSAQELHDRLSKMDEFDFHMEGVRMAVESGRMDFAEKAKVNAINYMTPTQIKEAINNQGMYQGTQLPMDALAARLRTDASSEEIQAKQAIEGMAANQVGGYIQGSSDRDQAMFARSSSLYGTQDYKTAQTYFQSQKGIYDQLTEAVRTGKPPAVINALQAQVEANSAGFSKSIDDVILRNAGGDKRSAGYIKSFVYGTPINAGEAAAAVTHFALKGGMPEGMMATPEAKAIFQEAQKIVETNRGVPGMTRDKLAGLVQSGIQDKAFQTTGAAQFDRMWNNMPQEAARAGNPFGKIGIENWDRIRTQAMQGAYADTAAQLGVSKAVVAQMHDSNKPVSVSPEDAALYDRYIKNTGRQQQIEHQMIVMGLDEIPLVVPGKNNSELLLDYLTSSQAQDAAQIRSATAQQNGLGDFFVGPLAKGALERNIGQQAQSLQTTMHDITATDRLAATRLNSAWAANPIGRANYILQSMPGIGKDGAAALRPFLQEQFDSSPWRQVQQGVAGAASGSVGGAGVNQGLLKSQENFLKQALTRTTFEDKRLEAFRKKAVSDWDDYATDADGVMNRMMDSLKQQTGGAF